MQRSTVETQAANKVTWIGAGVNAIFGLGKIIIGLLFHSAALIADGIHSLSDLLTDAMVVLILKISAKGPDDNHPWGHGHFETLGTVILGSILIAVAGALAYDSAVNLIQYATQPLPEWPVLLVAALSIAAKEWIYRYTLAVGNKIKSSLLIANAWHSRTDALSSVVVFIGVAGAMAGFPWLDSVAALFVAAMVAKIGWSLSWNNLKQLLDTALPADEVAHYRQQLLAMEGIVNIHSLKTRCIGTKHLIEIHLQIDPTLSASEGHFIGNKACKHLQDNNEIGHIIFHIDTFNDEVEASKADYTALPNREEIKTRLDNYFRQINANPLPYRLTLYYHVGHLDLELLLELSHINELKAQGYTEQVIIQGIKEILKDLPYSSDWLGKIYLAGGIEQ